MADTDQAKTSTRAAVDGRASEVAVLAAERLVFFSDAVVAIAITLLALDLPVPKGDSNARFVASLGEHWGEYLAFLISFVVIGSHWSGHHKTFRRVTGVNGEVIRWNVLWLMMIVITPFATRILTSEGAYAAQFTMYAMVQVLCWLFFMMIMWSLERGGLTDSDRPGERVFATGYRRCLVLIVAFGGSIPLAFFTRWSYLSWIVVPFLWQGVQRFRRRPRRA